MTTTVTRLEQNVTYTVCAIVTCFTLTQVSSTRRFKTKVISDVHSHDALCCLPLSINSFTKVFVQMKKFYAFMILQAPSGIVSAKIGFLEFKSPTWQRNTVSNIHLIIYDTIGVEITLLSVVVIFVGVSVLQFCYIEF